MVCAMDFAGFQCRGTCADSIRTACATCRARKVGFHYYLACLFCGSACDDMDGERKSYQYAVAVMVVGSDDLVQTLLKNYKL